MPNPYLDSREYEVKFEYGTREKYIANFLAENLYAQCDDEGTFFGLEENN